MREKNKLFQSIPLALRWKEAVLISSVVLSLLLLAGLLTYRGTNTGGGAGGYIAYYFIDLFGFAAYLLPFVMPYSAWLVLYAEHKENEHRSDQLLWRGLGFLFTLTALCGLSALEFSGGGIAGTAAALILNTALGQTGAIILLFGLLLCGITFLTGLSWLALSVTLGEIVMRLIVWVLEFLEDRREERLLKRHEQENISEKIKIIREPTKIRDTSKNTREIREAGEIEIGEESKELLEAAAEFNPSLRIEPFISSPVLTEILPKSAKISLSPQKFTAPTGLPSVELLDLPEISTEKKYSVQGLEQMSRDVEVKLKDFGIIVQVIAAHPGPVVTRFEMQLAPGIKVSKITSLAKDLARSLSVISVRVVEVIPGKSVVGLELPNQHREIVRLSEVLNSSQYQEARSPLSLALGKDIAGHPVVVDLGKMPHLLVAGTTGAGKSVGLNAMLLSLLFKSTPEEVQMIMIDPKMLELSIYEGIPHLLTPVVTDMKEAANALRWCVGEMERRYRLMSALGVRNLAGFNLKVQEAAEKGEPILDPLWRPGQMDGSESASDLQTLPYIVVIIDEFADMIMVVGKKVEELIARIAQKARAAGIHLVLATQRPSVDVITGLIKANIPTRIAFQVSSKIDSRTILDQQGAEQLLGHGDMLYLAPGTGVPIRVHGAFVADHEVHTVVEDWKTRGTPQYIDDILDEQNSSYFSGAGGESESNNIDPESDALYDEAVKIVLETRRASISSVQRRLRIGYNRAARLLEAMEAAGLISAMESNGSREVLVPDKG